MWTSRPLTIAIAVIDTQKAIDCFHRLMQPNSPHRLMRLMGEPLMGKSHLLTKVFPLVVTQGYQGGSTFVDLRQPTTTVPELLYRVCSQLGIHRFPRFHAAHQSWCLRPKVTIKHVVAILTYVVAQAKQSIDEIHNRDLWLTAEFVEDLRQIADQPLVILIDHVDQASEDLKTWLFGTFLGQVLLLEQIRVVVAGRELPEDSSKMLAAESCRLGPVKEIGEYLTFCKEYYPSLAEQSIRDFAQAMDYTPGAFAMLVSNWSRQGSSDV